MNQSTKNRCPKDTRRNKKTGLCEPVKKNTKENNLKKD